MDCYNSGDLLDEGGFGRVYEAARIKDGTRVAIKYVSKNKVTYWTSMSDTEVLMELMLFLIEEHEFHGHFSVGQWTGS